MLVFLLIIAAFIVGFILGFIANKTRKVGTLWMIKDKSLFVELDEEPDFVNGQRVSFIVRAKKEL